MSLINYANRELHCKLVYCGPGLSGKTTNILQLYREVRPDLRGRLVSLCTEMERTLYFDFFPLDLGMVAGFRIRFHLYSVPGQVVFAATRRLVLSGADGVVFVADSRRDRMDANYEAIRDLKENFRHYGIRSAEFPYVLQLNKRDHFAIHSIDFLSHQLRLDNEPIYPAVAIEGRGVRECLRDVVRQILYRLHRQMARVPRSRSAKDLPSTVGG